MLRRAAQLALAASARARGGAALAAHHRRYRSPAAAAAQLERERPNAWAQVQPRPQPQQGRLQEQRRQGEQRGAGRRRAEQKPSSSSQQVQEQQQPRAQQQAQIAAPPLVPVRAFYVARQLDLARARDELASWRVPFTLSRDCIIVHGGLDGVLVNRVAAKEHSRKQKQSTRAIEGSGDEPAPAAPAATVATVALQQQVEGREASSEQASLQGEARAAGASTSAEQGQALLEHMANTTAAPAAPHWHSGTFTVLFGFGATVTLNALPADREAAVHYATSLAVGRKVPGKPRQENYAAAVDEELEEWSELGVDKISVRKLDLNNVRVISTVLGQSVALDHYAQQVDRMLADFSNLNAELEATGEMKVGKERLLKLVVQNNSTMHDVMLKLRLMDRSADAAWQYARYHSVWEAMRDEFSIQQRFETVDFKLNLIQNQLKFFLDVLQNRKSDTLEWIIIVLISAEICVSLYDLATRGV